MTKYRRIWILIWGEINENRQHISVLQHSADANANRYYHHIPEMIIIATINQNFEFPPKLYNQILAVQLEYSILYGIFFSIPFFDLEGR